MTGNFQVLNRRTNEIESRHANRAQAEKRVEELNTINGGPFHVRFQAAFALQTNPREYDCD